MEIGVFVFIILVGITTLFIERTAVGNNFARWIGKKIVNIDVNTMKD